MVDSYYSFVKLPVRPKLLFKLIPIDKNIIEIFNLYDKCFHFRNFKNTERTEISFTLDLKRHEVIEIKEILTDVLGTEHVSITSGYVPWIYINNIANSNELIDKFIYATSLIKLRFPVLSGTEDDNVVNFTLDAYFKIVKRLKEYNVAVNIQN